MADFTVFGNAPRPDMGHSNGETDPLNVAVQFKVTVADIYAKGIRLYVPTGAAHDFSAQVPTGLLYGPGDQLVASTEMEGLVAGQWNEVLFATSVPLTQETNYKLNVFYPQGGYGYEVGVLGSPVVNGPLTALAAYYLPLSTPAAPSTPAADGGWYGIDLLATDTPGDGGGDPGGPGYELPDPEWEPWPTPAFTTTTVTGSATDVLAAQTSDAESQTLTGSSLRTVRRSMWEDRTRFTSLAIGTVNGPTLATSTRRELGVVFRVQRECRIPAVRIYKHPDATGTCLVNFWTFDGQLMATTSVEWVADGGGWREIEFPTAILLEPGPTTGGPYYVASYYPPTGHIAYSEFVYQEMELLEWPFVVDIGEYGANGRAGSRHSTIDHSASASMFPMYANEANMYIDPVCEYEEELPAAGTFPEHMAQYPGFTDNWDGDFLMGVYYPETPYLADYVSIGVNLGIGIPGESAYRDPMVAAGMYAFLSNWGTAPELFAGDPAWGSLVLGYTLWDEPDMTHNPGSPSQVWDRMKAIRRQDSTRPVDLNLGMWPAQSISYQWWPVGGNVMDVTPMWHQYGEVPDVLSCDWYNITDGQGDGQGAGTAGPFGIWTYPKQVQKMRQLSKGRLPVWAYIETAPIVNGSWPSPAQVKRATWACIIAGATGIVFFDHQFSDVRINGGATADHHWMLHNAPMRAGVAELVAEVKGLTDVIYSPEVDLITQVASSNTTAGPKGNTYGVPIHHTERTHGGYHYAIVQAIRPGATTGSFTAPTAAGKTITVLGESRSIGVNAGGEFTDTFSDAGGGYEYHIYRWLA